MTTNDPIQQTLERLQKLEVVAHKSQLRQQEGRRAYTVLVQSTQSLQVRRTLTEDTETSLYRKAAIRTPAENAHRDWFGPSSWWARLLAQCAATTTSSSSSPSSLLYLRMKPDGSGEALPPRGFRIVNYTDDPWGWDVDSTSSGTTQAAAKEHSNGLSSLQGILDTVQNHCVYGEKGVVAIDSLVPLYMRHGGTKLISFLQTLQELRGISTVLIRATAESLPGQVLQALQDITNAFLLLKDGTAHWLRQGVRERDNMIRQLIDFTIVGKEICLQEPETNDSASGKTTAVESPPRKPQTLSSGRPRIQLTLEEEKEPTAPPFSAAGQSTPTVPGPRIYLQDDDPEFEDFDEEDPDDDLDI